MVRPSLDAAFWSQLYLTRLLAVAALQDLHLILSLVATLLRNQPQLAEPLLAVTIDYDNNQKVDWVDIIVAALNVLPGLAARAATELQSRAARTQLFALPASSGTGGSTGGSGGDAGSFAWSVLNSLADCLSATAAAAACQPSRVLTALCSCQLFEGVAAAAEPLPLVVLEDLGAWVQEQQAAGAAVGSVEDWSTLSTLQASVILPAALSGWRQRHDQAVCRWSDRFGCSWLRLPYCLGPVSLTPRPDSRETRCRPSSRQCTWDVMLTNQRLICNATALLAGPAADAGGI